MAIKHGQTRKPCEFRPQEPGNQRSGGREELTTSSKGLRLSARPSARAARLLWFRIFSKKETPPQLYLGSRDPAQGRRRGHEERRVDVRQAGRGGLEEEEQERGRNAIVVEEKIYKVVVLLCSGLGGAPSAERRAEVAEPARVVGPPVGDETMKVRGKIFWNFYRSGAARVTSRPSPPSPGPPPTQYPPAAPGCHGWSAPVVGSGHREGTPDFLPGPCLVLIQFCKIFQILPHIKSLDTYMKY